METVDLCTEQEATAIAGVSPRTLSRFSEAGYLTRHPQADGTSKYSRRQVEEIFGTHEGSASSVASPSCEIQSSCTTGSMTSNHGEQAPEQEHNVPHNSCGDTANDAQDDKTSQGQLDDPKDLEPSPQYSRDSDEIARLRHLLSLQERILDGKDDEIADLRSQRAWLRERIERLEEKGDRDQILILSETQTIRSLIAYQESRKSTLRQFLEWAGLCKAADARALPQSSEYQTGSPSQSPHPRAIEVSKVANS